MYPPSAYILHHIPPSTQILSIQQIHPVAGNGLRLIFGEKNHGRCGQLHKRTGFFCCRAEQGGVANQPQSSTGNRWKPLLYYLSLITAILRVLWKKLFVSTNGFERRSPFIAGLKSTEGCCMGSKSKQRGPPNAANKARCFVYLYIAIPNFPGLNWGESKLGAMLRRAKEIPILAFPLGFTLWRSTHMGRVCHQQLKTLDPNRQMESWKILQLRPGTLKSFNARSATYETRRLVFEDTSWATWDKKLSGTAPHFAKSCKLPQSMYSKITWTSLHRGKKH